MTINIAATTLQKEQLMVKGIAASAPINWVANTRELLKGNGDVFVDCTFCSGQLPRTDRPLLIHSPVDTLNDLQAEGRVGRFCAWNTFLERKTWDVALTTMADNTWINTLSDELGWMFCFVQDEPGLVAPRIVSTMINEARYALQAGISTQQEIDLAMKLGTNYPYGPFEWEGKIGIENINALLTRLSRQQAFYQPAGVKLI